MIKRLPIYETGEVDSVRFSLNEWVWNSHYWIETYPGRYKCEWCGEDWCYNHLGEYNNFCPENPKIKQLKLDQSIKALKAVNKIMEFNKP